MTSPLLHDPSEPVGASQITCGGPPATATFFSLPSATKARYRLSGDQNGAREPSVPGSGFGARELSGRSHTRVRLSESCPMNAMIFPSGEILGMNCGVTDGGIGTVNRSCCFDASL